MSLTSYAENFEDVLLWRALRHVPQGWYVDVGAGHPQRDSVTRAFYERGWRGLNLEPSASLAALLRAARPADVTLPVAAGAQAARGVLFELPGSHGSCDDEARARALAGDGEILRREVEVQALDTLLAAHAPAAIHFMKIDANGAEAQVLAGLDLRRWRPWIVLVDSRAGSAWEARLLAAGYALAQDDGQNRYYAAAEQPQLLQALRLPPNAADDFVLVEDHPRAWPLAEWRRRVQEADATRAWALAHVQEWKDKHHQLGDAQQRASRAEGELEALRPRLANAEYTVSVLAPRLQQAESQLAGVYASLSWRVTRPLRAGKLLARRALGWLRRQPGRARRGAVGALKAGAMGAVRYVQARPRLAFFVRRQVSRFPWLVQALRTVVLRMQARQPAPHDAAPAATADLPAAARQVLDDLRRARHPS